MTINISWLDAITTKVINPTAIEDLVFRNAALLSYVRRNAFEPYTGGVSMDNAFLNAPMKGGSFAKGDPLSTDVVEPIAGQTFPPRTYYTTVAHYLENLAINRGPAAVFKSLSVKHRAAMNTLNNIWDIALYRHGQATVSGIISGDRSKETNGLDEALNDGITQGPFGDSFASYAGQSRTGGDIAQGYLSVPYFVGNATTGAGGEVNYHHLQRSYLRSVQGSRKPNIGLTNKSCWGFIAEKVQAQQMFQFNAQFGTDAYYGADSIKFMGADIMIDQYCPSTLDGVNDVNLGNYLLGTFTANSTNQNTTDGRMPRDGSSTITAGEAFYWLNSEVLKFRLSDHPLFNFGWKGYVPQANGTKIVGQILSMGTMEDRAPWLGTVMFGIVS